MKKGFIYVVILLMYAIQMTGQVKEESQTGQFGPPPFDMGDPPFMMMGNLGSIDQFGIIFDERMLQEPDAPLPEKSDSTYQYFEESKTFTAEVKIHFRGNKAEVSELPKGITMTNDSSYLSFQVEDVRPCFLLYGESDNCGLFIQSNRAVKIVLNGVDMESKRGGVIEVKGKKPVYIELAENSFNRLEDKFRDVQKIESKMLLPMLGPQRQVDYETETIGGIEMKKAENRSKELTKSDIDAVVKATGLLSFSGKGKLLLIGHNKSGIRSNSHIIFRPGNVIHVIAKQGKGLYAKGDLRIYGGVLNIDGSDSGKDGIRSEGSIYIHGGRTTVKASGGESSEGIEGKYNIMIDGGLVEVASFDDAINSGGNLVVNGGTVYAASVFNDALDSNGNLVLRGGLVVASGGNAPECGMDANEEEGYELYVNGGEIVATGGHASLPSKSSRQASIICNVEQLDSAGIYGLTYKDKALLQVQLKRTYSRGGSLFYSTPQLKTGTAYDIHMGCTAYDKDFHGVWVDTPVSGTMIEHIKSLELPYTQVGKEQRKPGPPRGMLNGNF